MLALPGYDRWKTTEPVEDEVRGVCPSCGDEIQAGDDAAWLSTTGDLVHEDCLHDWLLELMQPEKGPAHALPAQPGYEGRHEG